MTNIQLYMAIGIPSILILIGFWNNNARFNKMDAQLLQINADLRQFYHLSGITEGKVQGLEKRVDKL